VHINILKRAFGGILKAVINMLGKKLKDKTICNEQ
jgi:hypothetical protein